MKKLSRRWLLLGTWWCVAVAAVVTIGVKMERNAEVPMPGEPGRSQLESLFNTAATAVGGSALSGGSYFHRGEAVGVDGHILAKSKTSAFKILTEQFVEDHWEVKDNQRQDGEIVYVKLCKGGIATLLDGRGGVGGDSLYLGVIWARNSKHVAWCEK
ncbi:hypothetical protein P3W33_16695 [Luteibacter sp. PPL552]